MRGLTFGVLLGALNECWLPLWRLERFVLRDAMTLLAVLLVVLLLVRMMWRAAVSQGILA